MFALAASVFIFNTLSSKAAKAEVNPGTATIESLPKEPVAWGGADWLLDPSQYKAGVFSTENKTK